MINGHRVDRRKRTGTKHPSPLAGKLFDDKGVSFTPSHAVKNGRRYRYYVEREANHSSPRRAKSPNSRSRHRRISASEIEGVILGAISRLLLAPTDLLDVLGVVSSSADSKNAIESASRLAETLCGPNEQSKEEVLRTVTIKVVISESRIDVRLSVIALRHVLELEFDTPLSNIGASHKISIPMRMRHRGVELKLVINDSNQQHDANIDPVLVKALIKAHAWLDQLLGDDHITISEIAEAESVTDRYVRRILELAFLGPDIKDLILDGRQPAHVSTEWLVRGARLPCDWREQRHVLGFSR